MGPRWLPLLIITACTRAAPPEARPADPYGWMRCHEAARPGPVQDTMLGNWSVVFREGSGTKSVARGELQFRLMPVRADISVGLHICKDCLLADYFGPFHPFLKRPPPSRDMLAILRGDQIFVASMGSASMRPNRGDLAFCGALLDDSLSGIWWQNLPNGPWGTFRMERLRALPGR